MQGLIIWIAGAASSVLIARFIRPGRRRLWLEAMIAVAAALAAGIAATALDFGGWAEPDPRAFAFALLVAFAAIGLIRVLKQP